MITEQQYQEALKQKQEHFKKQGMLEEDWKFYKQALDVIIKYQKQKDQDEEIT